MPWKETRIASGTKSSSARNLRKEAASQHLDPNVWFDNVERVAARRVGRETVQYVSNIYKYYIAYSLVQDDVERELDDAAAGPRRID